MSYWLVGGCLILSAPSEGTNEWRLKTKEDGRALTSNDENSSKAIPDSPKDTGAVKDARAFSSRQTGNRMETPGTSADIVDSWSATGPVSSQSETVHALARDRGGVKYCPIGTTIALSPAANRR
ncbi:hypothetical protein Asppvi_003984 [Aspergillus pseudoviridinutans]|uniref:Uncharacterized protein n=1 Tax=Aspergillus pseudoviridinutans TaxID=1517512 RepID=A0A9P3BB19_9EURO|nr:uncharacterized protein Asppvi_003984 [Aspergillus pseudoviridinutans]GIJ85128.1 hypothetical protein Asppvi_003984 [Aspergillus pseudoviridinutans]